MRKSSRKIKMWLMAIVMVLNILPSVPILAESRSIELKLGDYIEIGTYKDEDLIWKVKEKHSPYGTLVVLQNKIPGINFRMNKEDIVDLEVEGILFKNSKEVQDKWNKERVLQESENQANIEKVMDITVSGDELWTAFYINESAIVFKLGSGTLEDPYTLYTRWMGMPEMIAEKDKVVISGVEIVGKEPFKNNPFSIKVDGVPVSIVKIEEDKINHTITLKLADAIKEKQLVMINYNLDEDATGAIAKAGSRSVIKEIPVTAILNHTIDQILPIETIITEPLMSSELRVGEQKEFKVSAKGEGNLNFTWYKDEKVIFQDVKTSLGQIVSSIYIIPSITIEHAGNYKVVVSGMGGEKITQGELKVIPKEYMVKVSPNSIVGGTVKDNSINQKGTYYENEIATVVATPYNQYYFVNWTENNKEVSRDRSYSFKVTNNRNLIANFKYSEPYTPQYTVHVTKYPYDSGAVTGDYTYDEGTYVTLRANPKPGYVFESWMENGKVVSREHEYSFSIWQDRWLEANFEKEKPREMSFKEEWRELSNREQRAIKDNFKEYLPYTTMNETFTIKELDNLTNKKFTDKQLKEVIKDIELLEDIGIDINWRVITLKQVKRPSFLDIRGSHWAYKDIIDLAKRGIVAGYPDETFKPKQELTVADTFTFLDRMLLTNDITAVKLPRSIVENYIYNTKSWAFEHVGSIGSKLSQETLKDIETLDDGNLSRELLAQILYEVTNGDLKKTKSLVWFTDTTYSPYSKAINYCVTRGLLEGTSSHIMSPQKAVTRAEMMTILQRLDKALND